MLDKAIYLHYFKKIERKLNQFDIQIAHFIPGRIRLKSTRWMNNEALLEFLKKEIMTEPIIHSVNYNSISGSMIIEFRDDENIPLSTINRWVDNIIGAINYKN